MLPWHHHVVIRLAKEYDLPIRQREQIIDTYEYVPVTEEFYNQGVSIETIKKVLDTDNEYLELMEKIINKSKFIKDENYLYGGRRKFLYEEFLLYVELKQYKKAFKNLIELTLKNINGYNNESSEQEKYEKIDKEYINSGIISLEEKDLIINMINTLKQSIIEKTNHN